MAAYPTRARRNPAASFAQGLMLILLGYVLSRSPFLWIAPFVVGIGVYIASTSFARLARGLGLRQLRKAAGLDDPFVRASLPRKVYWLLLAVAEVDGRAGPKERELVRSFLMERFVDPVTIEDLRTWTAQRIPTEQVGSLCQRLKLTLSLAECETVFFWCCLVAFADGRFKPEEHQVLQIVAQGFGFPKEYARRIFHQAKQQHFGQGTKDERPRPSREDTRRRAFEVLGLEPDATTDEIRSRHRELVKAHHPDAHAHLGPVAAQEATQRFRQIQEAYELLTANR